jgi:hypothetical protein
MTSTTQARRPSRDAALATERSCRGNEFALPERSISVSLSATGEDETLSWACRAGRWRRRSFAREIVITLMDATSIIPAILSVLRRDSARAQRLGDRGDARRSVLGQPEVSPDTPPRPGAEPVKPRATEQKPVLRGLSTRCSPSVQSRSGSSDISASEGSPTARISAPTGEH